MNDAMLAFLGGITRGASKNVARRNAQRDFMAEMQVRDEMGRQAEDRELARRKALMEFEESLNVSRYQPGGAADLESKMRKDQMLMDSYYNTVGRITAENLSPRGARTTPGGTPPSFEDFKAITTGGAPASLPPGVYGPPPPPAPQPTAPRPKGGGRRRSGGGGKRSGGGSRPSGGKPSNKPSGIKPPRVGN